MALAEVDTVLNASPNPPPARREVPALASPPAPPAAIDPPLAADTRVGEFRIRGLLGEGAMGQVYLAQDLTLGRRVALKLIKRSIMEGDAVERFLEEARATATFNHPHIVTIHAVGEHDGRPYLALEYLDGESLRTRLAAGPLPAREALRHARAIAEAIAEAHRRGIVHADLKPENVVIPRDGRVRVVDFGLARHAGGGAAQSASGTPVYMAPERWRGAAPTGAIDVWSFGITLHELVLGRRPLPDLELARRGFAGEPLELSGLPAAPWAPLVRDCLAQDPTARPTADELVRRLAALLDPRASTGEGDRCPFPGLAAFSREDAADYFGRRAELDALVEQLRTRALVPVVGPSGIGKSSFVRAALVPRLEETERWVALALRPGASPFDSLAAALAIPGLTAAEIAESLRRRPDSLSLVLDAVATHHAARVLLFLDQFEEAFTLAGDPAEAVAFCDVLARAAIPGEPWRIVLTVRDDFLGRLAAAPAMLPHLGAMMALGPLSPADLRAAVLGPLANADYEADTPELIGRIVDDVAGRPSCLPLLQFTCQSLWERRDALARRIVTAEYEAMGGATGALAVHAQRFLAELAPDEVRLVRGLLLSLIHPDGTRRPRLRAELLDALPEASRGTAARLIDRLLDRRLAVASRDADGDAESTTLEIAHEALATAWPQLTRWLDETFEERAVVAELEQAAQLWQRRGRRDDETWAGAALADAVRKVDRFSIALPTVSRAFLDASARRERQAQRRRRWIKGGILVVSLAVAIAASIVAVAFARKEAQARAQAKELERREDEANRHAEELAAAAADLGKIRLELLPFDWDPERQRRRTPDVLPDLAWRIYRTSANDAEQGLEYSEKFLKRGVARWRDKVLVEEVEVRSGSAFLIIDRGPCASSTIFLKRLPGYQDRSEIKLVQIPVPTCQASRVGMASIDGGLFIRNVNRDGKDVDEPKYEPAYSIDRTEVTRGAFAMFQSMQELTGLRAASLPEHLKEKSLIDAEFFPISGLNYATARSYCRYLGKDLPTTAQWQKAFRGGLIIGGQDNPSPKRLTPWHTSASPRPTNIGFAERRESTPARVGSYPDDVSPYGVLDLSGNVSEWSREKADTDRFLSRIHGGDWTTPPKEGFEKITRINTRPEEAIDFAIGVRCVAVAP